MISMLETEYQGQSAFCLQDGERRLAYCLYLPEGEILDVICLEDVSDALLIPLGLAVLSKMEYQGVESVLCKNRTLKAWLEKLRFTPCANGWCVSLKDYFCCFCNGGKDLMHEKEEPC